MVRINGETRQFQPISISKMLEMEQFDSQKVVVERNMEIVPRSQYEETILSDGDEIEVVSFVGGG